jgi:hypothetical protein
MVAGGAKDGGLSQAEETHVPASHLFNDRPE